MNCYVARIIFVSDYGPLFPYRAPLQGKLSDNALTQFRLKTNVDEKINVTQKIFLRLEDKKCIPVQFSLPTLTNHILSMYNFILSDSYDHLNKTIKNLSGF